MKLPPNTIIARAKVTDYLLRPRDEDDKSGFLGIAGYTLENPDRLINDLRSQILPLAAEQVEETEYGPKFQIRGTLTGPTGGNCVSSPSG